MEKVGMNTAYDVEQHRIHPHSETPVYLKANVKIEPLFCGWVTWSHLMSPVQAAMNIAFRYLPLLQSFVSNPQVHVAATKDPKLFGGPFVHLSPADVPQVRELIAKTNQRFSRLLKLANDVKALDSVLQDGCNGFSLNDAYAKLPESLKGMVELMYDVNNHPKLHLLEELLYDEYGADLRSDVQEIALSAVPEAERRFFMSTPRIKSPETLTIATQYANPHLDQLAAMRREPMPLQDLGELFDICDLSSRYSHLFTTEAPAPATTPDYAGDQVRIRYFGHACVLIQTATTSILIDPMFASEPDSSTSDKRCARLTINDLPDRIDYLVLTHCHQDHYSPEMLLQIRSRIGKIVIPHNNRGSVVDPSMRLSLAQLGLFNPISLYYFDEVQFDDGKIISLPFPGEHSDLEVYSKQSLLVQIQGRNLLFFVDSDGWDPAMYQRVAKRITRNGAEKIDALFIGMECFGAPLTWLYGPLLTKPITRRNDESRRLSGSNCERAQQIIQQFKCDRVFVYAMGQEPWLRYVMGLEYGPESVQLQESDKLLSYCRSQGMVSERLYGSVDLFL
jgi:hypothetical protein